MTVSASFVDYVLGQLTGLGGVSSRRMFGGVGLYCQGRFFGLIDKDTLYLKVDERNRPHYVSRRMAPSISSVPMRWPETLITSSERPWSVKEPSGYFTAKSPCR